MASKRPTYTQEQLRRYYDRINLPEDRRKYDISSEKPEAALGYLGLLQRYQLAAVPFENLSLHYSQYKQVTLHPDELYKKIIESEGRGGYCMENNSIFGTVLRSLGYTLYSSGARVNEGGGFLGWSHMINFVTIDSTKYWVDVGFGPNCSVHPLPLKNGVTATNIAPASARLQYKNIDENMDPNQRLWVFQHRINDESEWQDMYCFTEVEFLPSDYNLMNYYTSTSRKTWFTKEVVCSKMLLGEDSRDEVIGVVILQDKLKRRLHGKTETERVFESEEQRLQALKENFNIRLSPSEVEGIKGMVSEIKSK